MAVALKDKQNVSAPSAFFPNGDIKDNPGDGTGTPVNRAVYGDIHQFFARLLVEGGVIPNGLEENAYYGWQYINALKALIENDNNVPWLTTVSYAASWAAGAGFGYRKVRGNVSLRGLASRSGGAGNCGDTMFTLPAGYRPLQTFRAPVASNNLSSGSLFIEIATTGTVRVFEMGVANGTPMSTADCFLDNIQFDTAH